MSINVELQELRERAAEQAPFAYLVTVTDDARSHLVAVSPVIGDHAIACDSGGSTARNATARPNVTLVWPPATADGYSLIVDGEATVDDGFVVIAPSRAVLHRPAQDPSAACQNSSGRWDCAPITITK